MYRVGKPWKSDARALPDNYEMAIKRLENMEKRLKKSPDVEQAYNKYSQQYVQKGYVTKVQDSERSMSRWYLPHLPVLRPDNETTKVRLVFDASARYESHSLNELIHQHPKLQRELFDVLLRFTRQLVALVCDIAEMYLRIGIAHLFVCLFGS